MPDCVIGRLYGILRFYAAVSPTLSRTEQQGANPASLCT